MSSTVLVQTDNPLDVKPEELRSLVEGIRNLGQDARVSYLDPKEGTFGVTWWEIVTIWVSAEVGKAVINQMVALAAEWMKNRYKNDPNNGRPKAVRIARYEGEEGRIEDVLELSSGDEELLRRTPEAFGRILVRSLLLGERRPSGDRIMILVA